MSHEIYIQDIANGALVEQFNDELQRVLDNIADPNTEAKKARKITITLTLKPTEKRNLASVSFQTKSSLVPNQAVETNFVIDRDNEGNVVAAELGSRDEVHGQIKIDAETGEILEDKKVVNMKGDRK